MNKKPINKVKIAAIVTAVTGVCSAFGYQVLTPEQQASVVNVLSIIIGFII